MHVGTQLKARNDDDYRVFSQLGVNHICGFPPGNPKGWTEQLLTEYREHVESFGLKLDFIPLPLNSHEISNAENPNIMLGKSPDRDREIEVIQNIIKNCSMTGIPAVKYNLTLLGVVSTEDDVPELETPGRDDVTEGEVVITEKLREVVEEDQQAPEGPLVQGLVLYDQLRVPQEGVQELEQVDQQLLVERPALPRLGLVLRGQHLVQELSL